MKAFSSMYVWEAVNKLQSMYDENFIQPKDGIRYLSYSTLK